MAIISDKVIDDILISLGKIYSFFGLTPAPMVEESQQPAPPIQLAPLNESKLYRKRKNRPSPDAQQASNKQFH